MSAKEYYCGNTADTKSRDANSDATKGKLLRVGFSKIADHLSRDSEAMGLCYFYKRANDHRNFSAIPKPV